MVKLDNNSTVIEQGDLFFFYKPKIGIEEVEGIEDVQRFYMVTSSLEDVKGKEKKEERYRLFLIGQKQLPEIVEGRSISKERNWALNVLSTSDPEDIRKEFLPAEYTTKTKGKRRLAAAVPAGEGKYSIVKHEGHTELAYLLELPQELGHTQKEFEIKNEASYIISVKNPEISVSGFTAFSSARKPQYPNDLVELFGDKRWIDVDDPRLLDYQNTQLLLIGARTKEVENELGISIDEEKEIQRSSDIFKELKIRKEEVPLKPLLKGNFPGKEEIPVAHEIKQLSSDESPGQGGKKGGKAAANKSSSAAAVAKLLSGINLPKK